LGFAKQNLYWDLEAAGDETKRKWEGSSGCIWKKQLIAMMYIPHYNLMTPKKKRMGLDTSFIFPKTIISTVLP